MKTPLVKIAIASIYPIKKPGNLPDKNARCTPDTKMAVLSIDRDLQAAGGKLVLSDMFRSYEMQTNAHLDFVLKRKTAFSPPAGGSMHEAGRAFDMDLSKIKISLSEFWKIAAKYGMFPIISKPTSGVSESWHFDCPGSHKIISDYYKSGKADNMKSYAAMAASAILSLGVKVDHFDGKEKEASIQSGLIRLGCDIGNIDGQLGGKSNKALASLNITFSDRATILSEIELLLQKKFPTEYSLGSTDTIVQPTNLFA